MVINNLDDARGFSYDLGTLGTLHKNCLTKTVTVVVNRLKNEPHQYILLISICYYSHMPYSIYILGASVEIIGKSPGVPMVQHWPQTLPPWPMGISSHSAEISETRGLLELSKGCAGRTVAGSPSSTCETTT